MPSPCPWPPSEGQHEHRDDRRHDRENRPGEEHPRRRATDDESLAEELSQVVIALQYRRPVAPGDEGLRLVDHAEEEGREGEHDDEVHDGGHHAELQARRTTSAITM